MTVDSETASRRPRPPALPIDRPTEARRYVRLAILAVVQALALLALAAVLGSLSINGFERALLMVVVLAVLNAVVWPFVIRISLPLVIITIGLFTFVLNALFVWAAAEIVGGVEVGAWWTPLVIAFVLTIVNIAVGGALHVDGDFVWRSKVARRVVRRNEPIAHTDVPGVLSIQIDGLGHDVLHDAMRSGHAPFLARLVATGTHRLHGWVGRVGIEPTTRGL